MFRTFNQIKINILLAFSVLVFLFSCVDSNISEIPPVLKIQAQVGISSTVNTSRVIGDKVPITLDPNGIDNLAVIFTIVEGTTQKYSNVSYTVAPTLSEIPQEISITNAAGIYMVTITTAYSVNTDKTYTLTAKIESTTITREFKIKGKYLPIKSITLARKNNNTTKGLIGKIVDLTTVFDVTVLPENSNPNVTWSINPVNTAIATITDTGALSPIAEGTINVKITSLSDTSISSITTPFVITTYKMQAKIVANETDLETATALSDDAIVELNSNGLDKLVAEFKIFAESIAQTTDVSYSVEPKTPALDGVTGVTVSNVANSGIYRITLAPDTYTANIDATYTLTATITGTPNVTKFKFFIIKGKSILVTSLTLERKNSNIIKGVLGTPTDLTEVFDVTVEPMNATNKNVIWSIEPINTAVATISDAGLLSPISVGTVNVKVTSISETTISSTTSPFVITAYKIQVKVGADATAIGTITALGDDDDVELNPNESDKLVAEFKLLETTTEQRTGVSYVITPSLSSVTGVTVSNVSNSGIYSVTITPATFTGTTDATYTLTATVVGTPVITRTRNFIIKRKKVYKIQAKVGANATVIGTISSLGDDDNVELNPNESDKLVAEFKLLETTTEQTTGVSYVITPSLSSVTGVTVSNVSNSGIYSVTITPATFTGTTDATYTLTATITGTGIATVTKTRTFTIKRKKVYKIQAKVVANETDLGTAIALGDVVDITLNPNGTDKLVAEFNVLETTTAQTTGVSYSVSPSSPTFSTIAGITIANAGTGIYRVTIAPATYIATTDVTYTLTATITGTDITTVTETKAFTIKGKTPPLTVTGAGGVVIITTDGGTLQMSVMEGTVDVTTATWSVTEIDGTATTKATISTGGVLTALLDGMVRVKAVVNGKEAILDITISGQ